MLLLPQLLKLSDVRFAPFAMRRRQFPSHILFQFVLGFAALDLVQLEIMVSVDPAERAQNLPHHRWSSDEYIPTWGVSSSRAIKVLRAFGMIPSIMNG